MRIYSPLVIYLRALQSLLGGAWHSTFDVSTPLYCTAKILGFLRSPSIADIRETLVLLFSFPKFSKNPDLCVSVCVCFQCECLCLCEISTVLTRQCEPGNWCTHPKSWGIPTIHWFAPTLPKAPLQRRIGWRRAALFTKPLPYLGAIRLWSLSPPAAAPKSYAQYLQSSFSLTWPVFCVFLCYCFAFFHISFTANSKLKIGDPQLALINTQPQYFSSTHFSCSAVSFGRILIRCLSNIFRAI